MPDVALIAAGAGFAAGVLLTLVLLLVRRYAMSARELGSEADAAAYRALHAAGLAARSLRTTGDTQRAARHLRTLLGARAVAIVGPGGEAYVDAGGDGEAAGYEASARRIAERVAGAQGRQVFPRRHTSAGEAVGAPIVVDGRAWGAIVAFAPDVTAQLVRATGEVAAWCQAQLELAELDRSRTALAEAELRALRAQISPHFIYNALTAIASTITSDPPRARELVLEFADFTRYSFRRQGEFTTLAEELRSIHSYLELERARFGDRLEIVLRVAPESLATVIPFLSVQPLVENAVRHGLEPLEAGGTIAIGAQWSGTHTEITVEDDGAGADPERVRALLGEDAGSPHVGLRNVDTRLRQLYGPGGGLVVETAPGAGTLVRMRVPTSQPEHATGDRGAA